MIQLFRRKKEGTLYEHNMKVFARMMEFTEIRIDNYINSLKGKEAEIDAYRKENDELQKEIRQHALSILKLQYELKAKEESIEQLKAKACTNKNCPNRQTNL